MMNPFRWLAATGLTAAFAALLWQFGVGRGFGSWAFAVWGHLLLLVWAVLFYRLTGWQPPRAWLRPARWECRGELYRWLGVPIVRRALASRLWRRFNPDFQFSERGKAALRQMECAMVRAETGHFLAGMASLLFTAGIGMHTPEALWRLLTVNVLVNGYPIAVQRYNRARVWRVLGKCSERGQEN